MNSEVVRYTNSVLGALLRQKRNNAGLTQDAPEMPSYYLNQVLNYLHGYLPVSKRVLVDEYLAEKKYLPPVNLILDTKIVTP